MARPRNRPPIRHPVVEEPPPASKFAGWLLDVIGGGLLILALEGAESGRSAAYIATNAVLGIAVGGVGIFWKRLSRSLPRRMSETAASVGTDFRAWLAVVLVLFLGLAALPLMDYFPPAIQSSESVELISAYALENNVAYIHAEGSRMQQYAANYKALLIVLTAWPNIDIMTDQAIAKSIAYTIPDNAFVMAIPRPRIRVRDHPGPEDVNFYLAVIPNDVSPDEITKLTDVAHVGGKLLEARGVTIMANGIPQGQQPAQSRTPQTQL